ncbi:hypothetical protein ACQEV9_31385 [Streptomyces chartreusis]
MIAYVPPDGIAVGWADLKTGDITVLRAEFRNDMLLSQHLQISPGPA